MTIINSYFTANNPTVFSTAHTFAEISTVLTSFSLGPVFNDSIVLCKSKASQFMASRTHKAIVVGVINEMVSGKVLAGYISKASLRDTALYVIVMKIFEVVFIAIASVSYCS